MSDYGTDDIYNLAATFSYLSEIDPGLLDKQEQEKLSIMKIKILQSLEMFIDCLPDLSED